MLDCPEVQEIYILPGCFECANISWITRITTLKRLVIDERCFVESNEVNGKGICSLADWKSIEEIEIRYRCFMYYKSLEWSNMDNLKKISFGNQCFKNCKAFELSNLKSLPSIEIGDCCITNLSTFLLDDLPKLEHVTIGSGDCYLNSITFYDSCCRIVNCPSLRQLTIGDYRFKNCKVFELSNLESLQKLTIGRDCFTDSDFTLRSMYIEEIVGMIGYLVDKTNHD